MTTTDVCFSVDCLFRKQTRSELFVVKGDCNNNFSVVVCRKILSPPRRFKVKDLICDTSQIFLRNNAFIFFQKSDTVFVRNRLILVASGWHVDKCCKMGEAECQNDNGLGVNEPHKLPYNVHLPKPAVVDHHIEA